MDQIEITGGRPVKGTIKISGSKNSSLPILASSLLTKKRMNILNVPNLSDIHSMVNLLKSLNSDIKFSDGEIIIQCKTPKRNFASYDLVRKMRASFLVLGPLLARYGNAKVSLPGGCAIGARPIDIHLNGLKRLGVKFMIENGYVIGEAINGLKGARIILPFKSVGATENLMMAATLADGKTVLSNVAQEPEVVDLGNCLISMGANITGLGSNEILIEGQKQLKGCRYSIMPDRIELGTFILLVLGCSGQLKFINLSEDLIDHYINLLKKFKELKLEKKTKNILLVKSSEMTYKAKNIKTRSYPGFPTDLQAQLSAVMTKAIGTSRIEEKIFENRFMHVAELNRMGAKINIDGCKVKIKGRKKIYGAQVMATDLRASSSLIIAGLMAEGKTIINRVYHLDRGYEEIEKKLSMCNLKIKRIKN